MKYVRRVDYLVASIIYLGTHSYYWARSPQALARELSMDADELQEVFNSFPGLFRKSHRLAGNGSTITHCKRDMRSGKAQIQPIQTSRRTSGLWTPRRPRCFWISC